jgi:hypothetical protein
MSAIETTVETVLEQFASLDFKEQQKFAAAMTRHLQGSAPAKKTGKGAKKAAADGEEKEKREPSAAMAAWHALVKIVRDTIKERINPEKNSQTPVFAVAGRFKEEGNNEPSADEIVELYTAYMDAPWESKTAKARAAKSDAESVSSCVSAEKTKAKTKAVVAAEKPKAVAAEKPKTAAVPKAVAAPPPPAAKKAVVVAEESDDEVEDRAPVLCVKVKKDGYPAGTTGEDDTPPMAFERNKMLGGKKVKMAKKPWPAHCWENQEGGAYLGVWDVERKTFDTDYDDPMAEDE